MDKLTQKQETFCLKYFEVRNATEAAIIAGYNPKYCATNTAKLLKNTKIKARLEELRQKAEDDTIATVLERKQVLTEIIRGRFIDFMKNPTAEKLNSAALQEIKVINRGGENPVKTTTFKLHNPIPAITELNKMDGIYVDGAYVDNRKIEVYDAKGKLAGIIARIASRSGEGEGTQLPDG